MDRRGFLRRAGLAGVAGLAGCVGGSDEPAGGEESTGDGASTNGTSGDAPAAFEDHPAIAGLDAQPSKGPLDGTAVVAFEDPSCSVCRRFHEGPVQQIESNLVEPGRGAYVFRTYPVVYPWGKPASQALEATYARSESAFFSLLDHYFTNQSGFDSQNVLAETETFLEQTDLDAAAVRADAADEAYDDAVQADLAAGDAADAGNVTPAVFLFKDGSFVTKATGSVSYELIQSALEL